MRDIQKCRYQNGCIMKIYQLKLTGSILNPFAEKCSKDTRKKQRGAKNVMHHDWLKLYVKERDWLKDSHMTKGCLASE